jgi:hypothetical protein
MGGASGEQPKKFTRQAPNPTEKNNELAREVIRDDDHLQHTYILQEDMLARQQEHRRKPVVSMGCCETNVGSRNTQT